MSIRRWSWTVVRDLKYAVRTLRKAPGFALTVVMTFALGIGANAAIFSVVYGVLLRPLPYRESESVVVIQGRDRVTGRVVPAGFSGPDLRDWRDRADFLQSVALCSRDIFALETSSGFETVSGASVSAEFFSIMGAPMILGRPFTSSGAAEIVISARLWQQAFDARPETIGRQVRLNSQPYTIVGVVSNDFEVPLDTRRSLGAPAERPHLWAPSELRSSMSDRKQRSYHLVGRLQPGVSVAATQPLADAVAASIANDYPAADQRWEPVVTTLSEQLSGAIRPVLWVFLGAVGLVLLVACANVANLLLTRQSARSREIRIRMSLGASNAQLALHQLSETIVLAALGGLAGLVMAFGSIRALRILEPRALPRLDDIRVDWPVALFALGVASLAALLAAAAPIAQVWAAKSEPLRPVMPGHTPNPTARRMGSALVVVQLAVCVTLLVGAVLLARSFVNLLRTDVGIATHPVVAVELNLAMGRSLPSADQIALTRRLIERIRTIPGVTAVGAANAMPPNRSRMVFEAARTDATGLQRIDLVNPTPEYFAALGIPLRAGRFFTDADHATAGRVAILSASAARALFGDQDPIGRPLPIPKGTPETVVGVVGDVKYSGLEAGARETLYLPFEQYPFRNMTLLARTAGDPRLLAATVERALHEVDREIMRGSARTLDEVMFDAAAQPRFRTALLSAIAGLALLLGAVGLYGVVSYGTSRRTAEFGVRMALGATSASVMRMVQKEILRLALAGVVLGTAGAVLLTRTIEAFLFEVGATDLWSFVVAVVVLVLVAMVATYVPVRRATRIDPTSALRAE